MKLLFVVLALALTACAQVEQAAQQANVSVNKTIQYVEEVIEIKAPPHYTIVAFGDSLTEGPGVAINESYPAVLEQLLQERGYNVTVVNAGVSGETSSGARARIDTVLAQKPDIVIVETGVNDILQGMPAGETATNLNAIIDELQENNITVILAGMEAFGEYQGFSFQVQTMYPDIAAQQEVRFIPFFLKGVAGMQQYTLPDYVHPNAAGYRIIAEQNVLPEVEKALDKQ
jgi:acyl-CoA thioesterase I